ncbi:hypothetical protein Hanom_Chr05g00398671 [Helianthus anomalus]
MFVHLANRTKHLICVHSLTKQTNMNKLPTKRFMNCSLNVRLIYSSVCKSWTRTYNKHYMREIEN